MLLLVVVVVVVAVLLLSVVIACYSVGHEAHTGLTSARSLSGMPFQLCFRSASRSTLCSASSRSKSVCRSLCSDGLGGLLAVLLGVGAVMASLDAESRGELSSAVGLLEFDDAFGAGREFGARTTAGRDAAGAAVSPAALYERSVSSAVPLSLVDFANLIFGAEPALVVAALALLLAVDVDVDVVAVAVAISSSSSSSLSSSDGNRSFVESWRRGALDFGCCGSPV